MIDRRLRLALQGRYRGSELASPSGKVRRSHQGLSVLFDLADANNQSMCTLHLLFRYADCFLRNIALTSPTLVAREIFRF